MDLKALLKEAEDFLRETITDPDGILGARREFGALFDSVLAEAYGEDTTDHISANTVTLEVTDSDSGRLYRRTLPMDYYENDNGIRLAGESHDGKSSELCFISGRAIEKIRDITGYGADHDSCGTH